MISVELKKVGSLAAAGVGNNSRKCNFVSLQVELLDSPSLSTMTTASILNIKPRAITNLNYSLPLNDTFFKTSLLYVLKLYTNP